MKRISTTRRMLASALLSVLCLMAAAQSTLSVGELTAAAGKTASVPVYMTNSSEVVAVQFNIQLPFSKASGNVTLNENRSNGHTVSVNKINTEITSIVKRNNV